MRENGEWRGVGNGVGVEREKMDKGEWKKMRAKNGKRRGEQRIWGREVVFSHVWEVREEEKWRKSREKNEKEKK